MYVCMYVVGMYKNMHVIYKIYTYIHVCECTCMCLYNMYVCTYYVSTIKLMQPDLAKSALFTHHVETQISLTFDNYLHTTLIY